MSTHASRRVGHPRRSVLQVAQDEEEEEERGDALGGPLSSKPGNSSVVRYCRLIAVPPPSMMAPEITFSPGSTIFEAVITTG